MMKQTKTREQLIQMYVKSLEENIIPWRQRWNNSVNKNGVTNVAYKGINQLILSYTSYKENYTDSRWFTYLQIQKEGYKLKNAEGKGVPIEFWCVYDKVNRRKIDISEYERIIELEPEKKKNYKLICATSYVFNAMLIEGVPIQNIEKKYKKTAIPKFISNTIKNLDVKYSEYGDKAFYNPITDEIVLPPSTSFFDVYSYYATLLHEICHSTGNKKRLDRNFENRSSFDEAREELIAEISSSFLMQKLDVDVKAEHFNNHKAYIQNWIYILENKPNELFKAISESNKVCDYIDKKSKLKNRDYGR